MPSQRKIPPLSSDEWKTVLRVCVGCTKLVVSNKKFSPVGRPRGKAKVDMTSFLYSYCLDLLLFNDKPLLRPSIIRQRVSAMGYKVRAATLTVVLDSMVDLGAAERLEGKEVDRQWRKQCREERKEAISGPAIYYRSSQRVSNVKEVVTRPAVAKTIFAALVASGVLRQYLVTGGRAAIMQLKAGDPDSLNAIARSFEQPIPERHVESQVDSAKRMTKKEIGVKATEWADSYLLQHHDDAASPLLVKFYLKGELYFQALRVRQPFHTGQ